MLEFIILQLSLNFYLHLSFAVGEKEMVESQAEGYSGVEGEGCAAFFARHSVG